MVMTLERMRADACRLLQPFSESAIIVKYKRLLKLDESLRESKWQEVCARHEAYWQGYHRKYYSKFEPVAEVFFDESQTIVLSQAGLADCKKHLSKPLGQWLLSYCEKLGLEHTWSPNDLAQPKGKIQLFKLVHQTYRQKAKKLVLPIMSMRNKSNGRYRLLADGNMHMAINRYFTGLVSGEYALAVPLPSQLDDLYEFSLLLPEVQLVFMQYGHDITETRRYFWDLNSRQDWSQWSTCVLGIPFQHELQMPLFEQGYEFMLNVSQQTGLAQYADEWQAQHISTCADDACTKVWCYDAGQLELLPAEVKAKTAISQEVCNMLYYDRITKQKAKVPADLLVVPHRFSDSLYDWEQIEKFCMAWHGKVLFLDPACQQANAEQLPGWLAGMRAEGKASIKTLSKKQYVGLLRARPTVLYLADSRVLHITRKELEFFQVPTITKID